MDGAETLAGLELEVVVAGSACLAESFAKGCGCFVELIQLCLCIGQVAEALGLRVVILGLPCSEELSGVNKLVNWCMVIQRRERSLWISPFS